MEKIGTMIQVKKKFISMLLVLCMVLSLFSPLSIVKAENGNNEQLENNGVVVEEGKDKTDDPVAKELETPAIAEAEKAEAEKAEAEKAEAEKAEVPSENTPKQSENGVLQNQGATESEKTELETKGELIGLVAIDVERFTLGQGYFIDPQVVPFYEGDNAAIVIDRLLGGSNNYQNEGTLEDQFYLTAIKNADTGDINVPSYISENLGGATTAEAVKNGNDDEYLGEYDYTNKSGWICYIADQYAEDPSHNELTDGDVIRVQFTIENGKDVGKGFGATKVANKDNLIRIVAAVNTANEEENFLANASIKEAYDAAYIVLQNMTISQEETDQAFQNLYNALEASEQKDPIGHVTIDVERFTIGQGFFIEPQVFPFYEGDTGSKIIDRLLGGSDNYQNTGSIEKGFYLAAIKNADTGVVEVPSYIKEELNGPTTADAVDYGNDDEYLGEFDYNNMSGWMYFVQNEALNYGFSDYKPVDGDVIRVQFTLHGYGADLGSSFMAADAGKVANKDALTKKVAEVNSADNKVELLAKKGVKDAYDASYVALKNMMCSQEDTDQALVNLTTALEAPEQQDPKVLEPTVDVAVSTTGQTLLDMFADEAPTLGTGGGEWTIISLARAGLGNDKLFNDYYNNVVNTVVEKKGKLHRVKYTEYSRVILGLTAIGKDVTDVGGYDLLSYMTDLNQIKKQGINGPIWALIALDSHDYPIYDDSNAIDQNSRQKMVDYILDKEITNGGWSLAGDSPDPDITAMAISALAKYDDQSLVKEAIERGYTVLSNLQKDDGGYASWGAINSESSAQVILALCTDGIDPKTDARFIKADGNWCVSALMQYYIKDDTNKCGFMHVLPGSSTGGGAEAGVWDGMATDQGLEAMVSYQRILNGQTAIFDMTDVTIEMPLESIAINKDKLTLGVDGEETLTVGYTPEDTTVDKTIAWTTSDETLVSVTPEGLLKGLKEGTATITATVGDKTATCEVTVKTTTPLPDYSSSWGTYRKDNSNLGIVDTKLGRNENEFSEKWTTTLAKTWMDGSVGQPLIINDTIYVSVGSKIKKIDKETGDILAEGKMAGSTGFFSFAAYGDGMIFIPVSGGILQAFNADTLESVWQTKNNSYQALCQVAYDNGKVYMGTGNGNGSAGSYFCVSATDDDPLSNNEEKPYLWEDTQTGFYWAGGTVVGDAFIYGGEDGMIQSRNKVTGEVIDTYQSESNIRAGVAYDENSNRIFYTCKNAHKVYSILINSDGSFDHSTIRTGDINGQTTTIPMIYNGRVYVTAGGMTSAGGLTVLDAETLESIYVADLGGPSQASPLLTTAYATEENNHTVYMYVTLNNSEGTIKVIKDFEGNTTPDVKTAYVPSKKQYCTFSLISDDAGTMYYKNDSGTIFALEANVKLLESISLNKETLDLNVNTSEKLDVIYNPTDTTDDKTITWTSSDETIATVNSEGNVTVVSAGNAIISAKVAGKTATCSVNGMIPLTGISLNKTEVQLEKGNNETLSVGYTPENTTDDKTVVWSTSNDQIVTVDQAGIMTPVTGGNATITATVGSYTATCNVTITVALGEIGLNKTASTLDIQENKQEKLTVIYNPEDTTDDKSVVWSSSDEQVITVDQEGNVTAIAKGSAQIKAQVGNKEAICTYTVTDIITDTKKEEAQLNQKLPNEINEEDLNEGNIKDVGLAIDKFEQLSDHQKSLLDETTRNKFEKSKEAVAKSNHENKEKGIKVGGLDWFVKIDVTKDEENKDNIKEDMKNKKENGELLLAYDIKLDDIRTGNNLNDNVTGKFTVTIESDVDLAGYDSILLVHKHGDVIEYIKPLSVNGRTITFEIPSFSTVGIIGQKDSDNSAVDKKDGDSKTGTSVDKKDGSSKTANKKAKKSSNPKTGIEKIADSCGLVSVVMIAMIGLIGMAFVVKRKNTNKR